MPFAAPPPAPDRGSPNFASQTEAFLDWLVAAYSGSDTIAIEGSFTPVLEGSTTVGTGTYSVQFGRYSRIGNRLFFDMSLFWSAHTGTGNMLISGMPFSTLTGLNGRWSYSVIANNIALTAGNVIGARSVGASTNVNFIQQPVGGGAWSFVPVDTSGDVIVTGSYAL